MQLDVAGRSENFLVDTGATYSVLISYSGPFSSQTCTIWGATGKATTKRFTRALFCCWDGQYFPTSFWWSLSVLLPYWEEIYSLNWGPPCDGKFFSPWSSTAPVTTEEPITPSIERDQKLWEDKINPQVWDQGIPG